MDSKDKYTKYAKSNRNNYYKLHKIVSILRLIMLGIGVITYFFDQLVNFAEYYCVDSTPWRQHHFQSVTAQWISELESKKEIPIVKRACSIEP